MKKNETWIKKHLFSIILVLTISIISISIIIYASNQASKQKDNSEKRAILQLAATSIAIATGIGTILNTSRSAGIAAESVRLTREKDLREQSSHLIAISPVGGFPIDLPQYLSNTSQHLDTKRYNIPEDNLFHLINSTQEYKLQPSMSNVGFTLVNSGKGACLNLEYEFTITNAKSFLGYSFKFDDQDVLKEFPSYAFEIIKASESFLEVDIINEWMRKGIIYIGGDDEEALVRSTDSYKIKLAGVNRYHEIIAPQESIKLNLPTSYIILCRQYLIVNYLKLLIKNVYKNKSIPDQLKDVLDHETIMPKANIRLNYHNESDIRNGNYDFNKKTVELHSVRLIQLKDYDVEDEIPYFLEISPVK